jgi:hypothetical protein
MNIEKRCTFFVDGKIQSINIAIKNVVDPEKFFDRVIHDAKILTTQEGKKLYYSRSKIHLYLNYTNCGNLIDRIYLISEDKKQL